MSKRLAITIASVLAVIVLTATVVVVVVVSGATVATQESDYRACLEAGGLYEETTAEGMAPIAERCYAAVYGE